MKREFKVGDRVVYYPTREVIKLESVYYPGRYAFKARIANHKIVYFTNEGLHSQFHRNPMIFYIDDCPEWAKPPLPDIPVDQFLEVWNSGFRSTARKFAKFTDDGKVCAWEDGGDSYTTKYIAEWDHYRIIPAEEAEQIRARNLEAIK